MAIAPAAHDRVPQATRGTPSTPRAPLNDPYTQDSVPESEWPSVATVYVNWPTGSTSVNNIVVLCTVSGSPANPTVTYNRGIS